MKIKVFDPKREAAALAVHKRFGTGRRVLLPACIADPQEGPQKRVQIKCAMRGCSNKVNPTKSPGREICHRCESK